MRSPGLVWGRWAGGPWRAPGMGLAERTGARGLGGTCLSSPCLDGLGVFPPKRAQGSPWGCGEAHSSGGARSREHFQGRSVGVQFSRCSAQQALREQYCQLLLLVSNRGKKQLAKCVPFCPAAHLPGTKSSTILGYNPKGKI